MAMITFYEKPGCQNNTRQKAWLKASGHQVDAQNLLDHPWSKEELRLFFGKKSVAECFNPAAPAIKSGQLDPASFSEEEALESMIANPILIKRPLMIVEGHYVQGFDKTYLRSLIPLVPEEDAEKADFTTCPHPVSNPCK
ncbi:MAG: arsenate reductase family protein [Chlorobiales bacterium]|nr:arsenate reductase family protein [Chlorobiales bacterium]